MLDHLDCPWPPHGLFRRGNPGRYGTGFFWSVSFYIFEPGGVHRFITVMGVLWTLQSSHPGLSLYSALPLAYGTSYYAISLGVNILITILIVIRLFQYRTTVARSMPVEYAQQYLSIAAVLVESAALYSVFALCFLISYAVNNPINQVFLGIAQATQVCVPLTH